MVDGSCEPALAEKSFAGVGRIQCVAQNLERYAATTLQVFGLERRAHAAAPQRPDDAVVPKFLAGLRQSAQFRLGTR